MSTATQTTGGAGGVDVAPSYAPPPPPPREEILPPTTSTSYMGAPTPASTTTTAATTGTTTITGPATSATTTTAPAATMRAVVTQGFGGVEVLQLVDAWRKPVAGATEVVVRIMASSVNPVDGKLRTGNVALMRKLLKPPCVQGIDFSGIVESVGELTTRFKPGDRVFGRCKKGGAWAEYCAVPETVITKIPDSITFETAAAAPVACLTAMAGLINIGQVKQGARVLILGASGGVGSYAVKLCKHLGAMVVAVCSAYNGQWVQALGADRVIPYDQQNVWQALDPNSFDIVFDTVGGDMYYDLGKRVLLPKGKFISTMGKMSEWDDKQSVGWTPVAKSALVTGMRMLKNITGGQLYHVILPNELKDSDLPNLAVLMTNGVTPCVEKVMSLGEIQEANRLIDSHHTRGKLVLKMN